VRPMANVRDAGLFFGGTESLRFFRYGRSVVAGERQWRCCDAELKMPRTISRKLRCSAITCIAGGRFQSTMNLPQSNDHTHFTLPNYRPL
jgi:hypothetical protein